MIENVNRNTILMPPVSVKKISIRRCNRLCSELLCFLRSLQVDFLMKTKADMRRIHPIPLVICRTEADLESGEEMDRKKKKQNARKRGAAIEKLLYF